MASQIPNSVYRGAPVPPQGAPTKGAKPAPSKAVAPSKAQPAKAAPSKAAESKSADQHKPIPRPGMPQPQPGHPPMNRIPIVDHKGNMRGHVGHSATQATVARFLGRHGAKLGKHEGRTAWIGDVPPPPPPPEFIMGPQGPVVNPKAAGRGTDKPPFPPEPDDKGRGEAEVGLINARRDALIGKAKSDAKAGAKPKPKSK